MTQTKWINVNGNLYEGTIETVQNWDGSENKEEVIVTVVIDGIKTRNIVRVYNCYDSPEAYYADRLYSAQASLECCKADMERQIDICTKRVNYQADRVKFFKEKLDLLKHES